MGPWREAGRREMAAWVPPPPRVVSRWRFAAGIVGTLVLSWAFAVAMIWAGCLLSGACQ